MKSTRKKWEPANSGSFRRENFFLVTKTEKNGLFCMKKLVLGLMCFMIPACFASPDLEKYLENDLELKKLALEVKKAELSSEETSIDTGINVQISTGTITLAGGADDFNVTLKPSVTATVPVRSNLKFAVSSSVAVESGEDNSSNTKFSLSADIISGASLSRRLKLMNAERMLLTARRNLQNRALEAEKEFYTELKALFTAANAIVKAQQTLYDDTIDFEDIKAKGYAVTSSKYRLAELKVLSDSHDVETKIRELEHDCAVFASKCSDEYKTGTKAEDFLPKTIQYVEPVDILAFEKNQYASIEKAVWTYEYNSLERKSVKNVTLSANAGYTLKNSSTASSASRSDMSDTVDAGATAGLYGLSLGAGVSFPVENPGNPVYSLSASVDPAEFRKARITTEKNGYSEEQDLIAIQSAEEDYDTSVVDQQQFLSDIIWSRQTNAETYEMYVRLEKDMAEYLKAGIITESEYLNAFANREQYRLQLLINDIDLIIYNNTTKLLFCRDEEIL